MILSRTTKFILVIIIFFSTLYISSNLRFFQDFSVLFSKFLFGSEIKVVGNIRISKSDIIANLPDDVVVWSWRFNPEKVKKSLSKIALLKSSEVTSCSFFSFNCYEIKVQEEKLKFIYNSWILSENKRFLFKIPEHLDVYKEAKRLKLPVIKLSELSEFQIKEALNYVVSVYDQFVVQAKLPIKALEFQKNGEFSVLFDNYDFVANFSELKDANRLKTEIDRFNKVLEQSEGRLHVIKSIDLALEKMAVVKLNTK